MISRHLGWEAWRWCEGRLSPEEGARVEAHLARCGECRAEMRALQEMAREMKALPAALDALPVHPAPAWASVRARLQTTHSRTLTPHPAWRVTLSLACVLVIFGVSNTFSVASAARAASLPVVSAPSAAATALPVSQSPLTETVLPSGSAFAPSRLPAYTLTPTPDLNGLEE